MAKQLSKIVSPRGIAVYPWLNRPDTKFSPDGDYKVTLRVGAADAQPLVEKLDEIINDYHLEESKHNPKLKQYTVSPPYEDEVDDQGNLTGNILFKFKQKAKIQTKDGRSIDMKVALVDASRTPTTANIGGGSEIKIAATAAPYVMTTTKTVGMTLRPNAVQILRLAQGNNVVSLFDDEDGFITDETAVPTNTPQLDAAADF